MVPDCVLTILISDQMYNSGLDKCNSYSFDAVAQLCQIANISFLEDPLPDDSDGGSKKIMVDVNVIEMLPRTCRGGEHCCRPDQPCVLDGGDCNHDHDCQV